MPHECLLSGSSQDFAKGAFCAKLPLMLTAAKDGFPPFRSKMCRVQHWSQTQLNPVVRCDLRGGPVRADHEIGPTY